LNLSGSINIVGIIAKVRKIVEIPNCHLRTLPTVSTVMVKKLTHSTERNEAKIPVAVIIRGK
jgi:hypothetical protein